VNASNTDKDWAWMSQNNRGAQLTNESSYWGQIAVQGPKAAELLKRVSGIDTQTKKPFSIVPFTLNSKTCYLATTGYTGEAGAEIFVPASETVLLWNELLKHGADLDVQPIGLGARDTLRTEMKYSLYGHEIDDTTNPYAASLGWVVKPTQKDFMGKNIILAAREKGLTQNLIGFKLLDKGIPRQGYTLFSFDNKEIGKVTSGTLSPSLDEAIGIAYLDTSFCKEGTEFAVDIRGRKVKAVVVKTPFVKK
jgi:aminomethyltransferase